MREKSKVHKFCLPVSATLTAGNSLPTEDATAWSLIDWAGQNKGHHTPDRASEYKSLAFDKRNTSSVAMLLYPTIMRGKEKRVIFKRGYCEKIQRRHTKKKKRERETE